MKILFLSQRIPYPPNRGDKIRSFHILKHLARHHTVSVACLIRSEDESAYARELESYGVPVHTGLVPPSQAYMKSALGLLGREPLILSYYYSRALEKTIHALAAPESCDLIYVFSSAMAQYVPPGNSVPKVLDMVDIDSDKWTQYSQHTAFPMSVLYRTEGKRLQRYEATVASQFDECLVISKSEKAMLQSSAPRAKIAVISNGVDSAYFVPDGADYEPNSLVFTGVMDYYANVDGVLYFCDEILPLIQAEIPQVKFYIVGSHPAKKVQQLGQREGVTVTGFVDDIRTYLRSAAVSVVPLRIARGVQNKVLEAMSTGVPVVTTPKAFEGIEAKPEEHLLIADTPQEFANRTISLLRDPALRHRLASAGRKRIVEYYGWDTHLANLDRIINGLVKGGG